MTWPNAPLIIIDKGTYHGDDISGTTATPVNIDDPECSYYMLDGPRAGYSILEDAIGEEITAWRPCVAVPIGELVAMRSVFMGIELTRFQYEVIQKLFSHTTKKEVNDRG